MSSACQPRLLPNLSLDKMKLGLWHTDNGCSYISLSNQAQTDPFLHLHSGLCFRQNIGYHNWQAQPPLNKATHMILYCSPGQRVFKYWFELVMYSFANNTREEDLLLHKSYAWSFGKTRFCSGLAFSVFGNLVPETNLVESGKAVRDRFQTVWKKLYLI